MTLHWARQAYSHINPQKPNTQEIANKHAICSCATLWLCSCAAQTSRRLQHQEAGRQRAIVCFH